MGFGTQPDSCCFDSLKRIVLKQVILQKLGNADITQRLVDIKLAVLPVLHSVRPYTITLLGHHTAFAAL